MKRKNPTQTKINVFPRRYKNSQLIHRINKSLNLIKVHFNLHKVHPVSATLPTHVRFICSGRLLCFSTQT